jgi:hypothetical protein
LSSAETMSSVGTSNIHTDAAFWSQAAQVPHFMRDALDPEIWSIAKPMAEIW